MHFKMSAAPTGSGKTRAATTFACERIKYGLKTAILQPTIRLCRQSSKDARMRFPEAKSQIKQITSNASDEHKVSHRITDYLNNRDQSGALLYITHAGFLRTEAWHRAKDWDVYLDEAIDIAYHRRLRLKDHRHLLDGLFHVHKANDCEKYGILEATDHSALQAALNALDTDEIHEHFADMTSRLTSSNWNLYVDLGAWQKFQDGKMHDLEVHGLLHPSVFDKFASTTLMAANLTDTLMYRYFAKQGATFSGNSAIERGLLYNQHANGDRLVIKYLTERKWSKTLRDKKVYTEDEDRDDPDAGTTIGALYMELCQKAASEHSTKQPLWIGNNDIHSDEFNGVRLSNMPHGMNDLQDAEVCCIMSALNPPPAHGAFLQEMCGMNERELRTAILSQTAYQACGRGLLRNPDSTGIFLLIAPDHDTALDIARYYPGCRIEPLMTDYRMPAKETGRPTKYATDEERQAAKREQDRQAARQYRVRKNSLISMGLSSDADNGITPSIVPHYSAQIAALVNGQAARQLCDLAAETTQYSPQGGFAASYWQNKHDKWGLGHDLHLTTAEFHEKLARRAAIELPVKESSILFSPHIFLPELHPGHARTKQNSFVTRGIVLDIENSDMTPSDYQQAFPELEMIVYSSFSHTPEAPRYRICIPTTHYMLPDVSEAICRMIAHKLDDRQHGIDAATFDPASLFYMPCKTEHSFLEHHHERRQPLNPFAWIEQCPFVVWQEMKMIEEVRPAPIPTAADPLKNSAGFLAYMENRWRSASPGKGRTEFWFLAQGMRKLGWDDQQIREKLEFEAMHYARTPRERLAEITDLLRS
jgi:hypothetical protein